MQAAMDNLQDPHHNPSIQLGVTEYMLIGDGSVYEDHVFGIRVQVDTRIRSTVYRSYADLTEFHARIQKKFPRTELPELPLEYPMVRRTKKKTNIFADLVNLPGVHIPGVEPLRNLGGLPSAPESPFETNEDIGSKRGLLQDYFLQLMANTDIAASDEFCMILDEESADGETLPAEPVSEFDILLAGEEEHEKTILRNFDLPLQADAGEFLVWKFSTKTRDIGFSLDFGGMNVLAYSRQESHEKPVKGILEAPFKGSCVMKWDNSYSSFLTRTLTYQARVAKAWEVENAQRIAREKAEERRGLELQRVALKRALTQHATAVTGVFQSSQSNLEAQGSNLAHTNEMEGIIRILKEEKLALQRTLQMAEHHAHQAKTEWEREMLRDPRVCMVKADLESAFAERSLCQEELFVAKQEAAALRWSMEELRLQHETLKRHAHQMQENIAALQIDVVTTMDRVRELQQQNSTLKAEKKTLKSALRTVTAQKQAVDEMHTISATVKTLSEITVNRQPPATEKPPELDLSPQPRAETPPLASTPVAEQTQDISLDFDAWYANEFGDYPGQKQQDGALSKFKEKFLGFVDRMTIPVSVMSPLKSRATGPSVRDDFFSKSSSMEEDVVKAPVVESPSPPPALPEPVILDPLPEEEVRRIVESVLQNQHGTFRNKLEGWLNDLNSNSSLSKMPWEFYIRSVPTEARKEFMQEIVPRFPLRKDVRVDVEWTKDTQHDDEGSGEDDTNDTATADGTDADVRTLDILKIRLRRSG